MAGITAEAVNVDAQGRDFAPDEVRAIAKSKRAGMVVSVCIMTGVAVDRRPGGHVVAGGAHRIPVMPGQDIGHRGGMTEGTGGIGCQCAAVMDRAHAVGRDMAARYNRCPRQRSGPRRCSPGRCRRRGCQGPQGLILPSESLQSSTPAPQESTA